MKIKTSKTLYISFTGMEDFLRCPRLYYWRRIRKLEKIVLYIPYVIGRMMGPGINALFTQPKKAVAILKKEHTNQKKLLYETLPLSAEESQQVTEQLYVGQGMLEAYKKRYGKFIAESKILKHEAPFFYQGIKDVVVVGKLDNIILNRKENYVHELKTTSTLTPSTIRSIKTKMQPALYLYLTRRIKNFGYKLSGIIYDIIKKPSIRVKKKETYSEYLHRLIKWYHDESENKFHLERMKKSDLTEDFVMNTIGGITAQLKQFRFEKEAYYPNPQWCCPDRGFQCEMFELCHGEGGESNPTIMVQYRKKKDYKVRESEQ